MDQTIIQRFDKLEAAIHKAASKVNGSPDGKRILSGWDGATTARNGNGWVNGWPVERLKQLEPYDMNAVSMLTRDRQMRVSGMGPYLCKMAGLAASSIQHNNTLTTLKNQGLWDDNYNAGSFMKEFDGTWPAGTPYVRKGSNGFEVRKAALAENSGQTGGYIIPPQFQNELLTIAAEDGFIEPRAKILPMSTRTVQWPMLDITAVQSVGTSPYFGGILAQWQPEAASISETEPAFKQTDWTAWDLVLYTVSSNQLLADNGVGLDALLTQLFGQAITWYKEYAYLQGKGAGSTMPLGIVNAPASLLQSRNAASHFQLRDAAAMLSHLQIRSWDDACWVMHQSVIPELIQLSDVSVTLPGTAGQHFSWMTPYGNMEVGPAALKLPKAFLNGLPIFFTEKLPSLGTKGDVCLVDWSRYVIGMRLDLQIDVSPHLLFRTNQLAWRVVARVDGKPWMNSFITDQTGWQISPIVVLQ